MLPLLFAFLAPHECLGCGGEGFVLCPVCTRRLRPAVERCYRCQRPSPGGLTCSDCRMLSPLVASRSLVRYETLAKQAIWQLKFQHARAVANDVAILLAPLLSDYKTDFYITHAPTANSRIRQRGYDQARLIAVALAQRLPSTRYAPLLARLGNTRQVGAKRQARFQQQTHAFRATRSVAAGSRVIVVDDIITTGATLEAAAQALCAAGASHVEALTFAQKV